MTLYTRHALLTAACASLRPHPSFANARMLNRAVWQSSAPTAAKTQKPLKPISNMSTSGESTKRKFDRTMSTSSSLSTLHKATYFFDENDFDDDATIDLTGITAPRSSTGQISYPSLDLPVSQISYPTLPSLKTQDPPSSASVPWSSSPPEHHEPPAKRRTVPWLDKHGNDKTTAVPAFTPLPRNKVNGPNYPWNKSASTVKDEEKELRKRNRLKTQPGPSEKSTNLSKKSSLRTVPNSLLSDEQKAILKVVEDGKSVFFTGSAGTGKSVLMKQIITKLRDKYVRETDRVAVTASTGLAACNIEGITLHSFAGIGLGKEPAPELVKKIKRNAKHKLRWARVKVLIIDEISMVDGDLFDKLEQIARTMKGSGRPFGGIQLIVTGDFFQLPPVPERDRVAKFAFDAATWNTCIEHTILLTHVFRQKDPVFANMLNEMRLGKLSQPSIQAFQRLSRPLCFEDDLDATELFPTRAEVDTANNNKMKNLSGELFSFVASDSGIVDETQRKKVLANFMAQERLELKKGAQVMLIKNIDDQLVNGSTGKVVGFFDETDWSCYHEDEETFNRAHRPEGESDEEENAKAREKLKLARFKHGDGTVKRRWPTVRFTFPDNTARTLLCLPEEWKTENPAGEIVAKRLQVPLILAWALSIHKAQGQTLARVKVDLGKVFEKGQAYVALSRATTQEGLQVLRFDHRKVMVHQRVLEFYNKLVSIESVVAQVAKGKAKKAGVSAADYERGFLDNFDDDDEEDELEAMHG